MKVHVIVFILLILIVQACSIRIPGRSRLLTPSRVKKSDSLVTFRISGLNEGTVADGNNLTIRGGSVPYLRRASLNSIKILLQGFLTSFNALCWMLPLQSKSFTGDHALLSLANCFAGGIFLMLSFGHLIPCSMHQLTAVGLDGTNALLYAIVGYLVMFTVEKIAFNAHGGSHHHDHPDDGHSHCSKPSMNSAKLLCIALCLHSFFEAASLGLSTDATSAYVLTFCIALHQPAESMALLVAFLKSNMSHSSIAQWMSVYSGVTLLGQAAGQIVNRMASTSMEAIVTAITAGTFIYVGATEIANEEFEEADRRTRVVRFLSYLLGMGTMLMIIRMSGALEHSH